MQRVSDVLKSARIKKGLSQEQVEKDIKIRLTVLQNLEEGRFDRLPSATFVRGFIKNYGDYLGLSSDFLLALYRREASPAKSNKSKQSALFPLGKTAFSLSNHQKISLSLVIFVVVFGTYLAFQYFLYSKKPLLEISTPQDKLKVSTANIDVVGRTDPDAKIFINGQEIQLKNGGIFSQDIVLREGPNTISITAISKSGQETKVGRTVLYQTSSLAPVSP
ncbi:helix-turn-helix domain-containing protein [Candidatus Daviesbacteria bacterium]|nr:helix-turn-helix domain-containing protein [Candidatus Daviesbacteria bacterium]